MSRHYLSVSPESNIREMACQSRVRVLERATSVRAIATGNWESDERDIRNKI